MVDKKKLGFDGQWVEIFSTGRKVGFSDEGEKVPVDVDLAFLRTAASTYDPAIHEAPACIGHPANDAPAYGWIAGARVNGNKLEVQFADTQPAFEQAVRGGLFKKRSPKFYMDDDAPGGKGPYIRHVAFLGAMPPADKSLKDIQHAQHAQFSENEGKTIAFELELSEGEGMTTEHENRKPIAEQIAEYFQGLFKTRKGTDAAFSETEIQTIVDGAIEKAKTGIEASFSEQITALKKENAELKKSVDAQAGSSQRGAIVSFCESLPAKVSPAMKKMGIVEFMETLDVTPATKKVSVISFAEEGGKEIEKPVDFSQLGWFEAFVKSLPDYVSFGESFGDIKLKGDGSDVVNPQRMDVMRAEAGITKPSAA
jgi:hypothetical protein